MLQHQNDVASMQHMSGLAFDDAAFFEALERHRQEEGLSWRQLGRQLGLSPSTFSRLARGRRPDIDTFLTLLAWLDVPASSFMRGAGTGSDDTVGPDTLGVIASALRSDPAIEADAAGALEQLFRVAYGRLRTEPDGERPRRRTSRRIDGGTDRSKGAL
jgi:transcriptional regulator with XRE-family HTH domain